MAKEIFGVRFESASDGVICQIAVFYVGSQRYRYRSGEGTYIDSDLSEDVHEPEWVPRRIAIGRLDSVLKELLPPEQGWCKDTFLFALAAFAAGYNAGHEAGKFARPATALE